MEGREGDLLGTLMIAAVPQTWTSGAIHDTVAALVRDRAYRRSIFGSLLGRALTAVVDAVSRLIDWFKHIPGGRTTVVAVVGIVVALVVARVLLKGPRSGDELARRRRGPGRSPRSDLWTEAERLAADGDFTAAAHALYQAVLRRLAGSERIRLHASKTSGDYSRELRRHRSPVAGPFQQFGRRFDRVIFGVGECSSEEFSALLREASAITLRQVA